jgi:hypothetical protein
MSQRTIPKISHFDSIERLKCTKVEKKNQSKQKDTGRLLGSFFQHMFMISRSNGGQWSGIFGFNPLSLLLKIKQ